MASEETTLHAPARLDSPPRSTRLSLFLLSAATLIFEINLTRIFSVAQFYHFAFLIVSLALLGFGASGTALAIFPQLGRHQPQRTLSALAAAAAITMLGAYLLINWLPFDSFSIAWDRRQAAVLTLNLLALASPFFFSGMAVGLLLSTYAHAAGRIYAVNLAGSALGCLIALAAPVRVGGEGTVALSCGLAALAGLTSDLSFRRDRLLARIMAGGLLLFSLFDLIPRVTGQPTLESLTLRLSPYKGLSYTLQYPGAEVIYRRWNSFSRVDVVRSPGIRSLPGLSYRFSQLPPPQNGVLVDGDDLSPILLRGYDPAFVESMPAAAVFQLRPEAEALILEPRGGLDVIIALESGARRVTAVEVNPLIVEAAGSVYADSRVRVVVESDRSYLRRSRESFDVVVLSLTSSYHPIRSGAYSIAEDYRDTVEAIEDALARLGPDGVLVVSRWLQMPPSEELRAFALAVTALEREGLDPAERLIAFRGYNLTTLLIKKAPFTQDEVDALRAFAADRAFDLIYAPGIRPDETNQYNILPEDMYYQAFTGLLAAESREAWYTAYPFEVAPPTDDRPFFGHFFKWSQAPQVLAELGKTWQPFGGAGYFVVLALLGLAAVMAAVLILLPLVVTRIRRRHPQESTDAPSRVVVAGLVYFGLIGFGFLLVEIPLIQRFILFLGQPAYALTTVLFSLLLFSGVGSQFAGSSHVHLRLALATLSVLVFSLLWLLPNLFAATLGLAFGLRLGVTVIVLAPVGLLMGLPFPLGIRWLERESPTLIPWVWGVNGAASVVSSVLAALLALSVGFSSVLVIGAICYAGAGLTAAAFRPASHPRQ